jgi:hypothetical protein
MSLDWVVWSNPVALWWSFLVAMSAANIAGWLVLYRLYRKRVSDRASGLLRLEPMILLSAAYVFGCAFRSLLPRADVQRIVLFDTWLSSVLVGRSVATIAEICFVVQWAIILRQLGRITKSDTLHNVSTSIVVLILLAECCSWYAVVTTNYLGNAVENSLWAIAFLLIFLALGRLLIEFGGAVRAAVIAMMAGVMGYLAFLVTVDVPMYLGRWQSDVASGKQALGLLEGLYDLATRWTVTRHIDDWRDEIAWMSLYFSVAVWSSLVLCGFDLLRNRWPGYRRRPRDRWPEPRPAPVKALARRSF